MPCRWLTLLLLGSLVLTGCVQVGPRVVRPAGAPPPPAFQYAPREEPPAGPEEWWKGWGDQELNSLVEAALKGNLDLQEAAAAVLKAGAALELAESSLHPSLTLEGGGQYARSSVAFNSVRTAVDRETASYNLSLAAAYEVDVWSRIKHAREAARADLLRAGENRFVAAQGVAAQVVAGYLTARSVERRILVSDRSIEAYTKSLEMVEGRYRRGLTSILEVRQARRTLAQARASRPALVQELGQTLQSLALLTGRYPRTRDLAAPAREYDLDPGPVPAGLPSELLKRRPDVRAAEAELTALAERIGQARAARFPVLRLTGSLGFSSDELDEMFTDRGNKWALALGLSAPLYDGGGRSAQQRSAQADYQRGLAGYAQTVLGAFGEVEKALLTAREKAEAKKLLALALQEAVETQAEALSRYQRGLTDYLKVIDAQASRYQIEDQLVLNDLALWTNRVTLYRALGGGWAKLD